MSLTDNNLIDWTVYGRARSELGADFVRILGYFSEDGAKSVEAIEQAVRSLNAVAIVIPAHTLKGESRQFGAEPLGDLAETIEAEARACIERRDTPETLVEHVVKLRPLFEASLALLQREANPLVARRAPTAGFGKRPAVGGGFGRA